MEMSKKVRFLELFWDIEEVDDDRGPKVCGKLEGTTLKIQADSKNRKT